MINKKNITRKEMTYFYISKKMKDFSNEGVFPHAVRVDVSKIVPYIQGFQPTIEEVDEILQEIFERKA